MSTRPSRSALSSSSQAVHPSPYRPQTMNNNAVDKSSIIWKDFLNGVKKRKAAVARLKDAALENINSQSMLKRLLLEVRQTTLRLIEDALEIEYRAQVYDVSKTGAIRPFTKQMQLPPVSSFRNLEEKDDVYALAEIITDADDLFKIPNIRVMLPMEFPSSRNPFMLGKSVDELAYLVPPHPEPGNVEVELKVLELLRYKRASRALLRAESQVLNRLPVSLFDVERLLAKMTDDLNLEKLLRCVSALLDNDRPEHHWDPAAKAPVADLTCLLSPVFNAEAHELVNRLNQYTGLHPVRIEVQAAVRQMLRDCVFDYLEDAAAAYLLEWLNIALGSSNSQRARSSSQQRSDAATATSASQGQGNSNRPSSRPYRGPTLGAMLEAGESSTFVDSAVGPANDHQRGSSREARPRTGSARHAQPRAVSPLTQKNLIEHNYTDLTSVVSMGDTRGTHEGIYVEPAALLKMRQYNVRDATTTDSKQQGPQRSKFLTPIAAPFSAGATGARHNNPQAASVTQRTAADTDDASTRPSVVGNRRIRAEVERIIRELGVARKVEGEGADAENESSALSAMRFELVKMQQELLRRHVLDPRHYHLDSAAALNGDAGAAQRRPPTKSSSTSDAATDTAPTTMKSAVRASKLPVAAAVTVEPTAVSPQRLVHLAQKSVTLTDAQGYASVFSLEAALDLAEDAVVGTIAQFVTRPAGLNDDADDQSPTTVKTVVSATKFSRLIFNRLTQSLLDELAEAQSESSRAKLLQNVFDQLEARARETPLLRGRLLALANRVLFNSVFTEDGVLVDMVILRNDACTGLVIHCTPLSGLHNATSRRRRAQQTSTGPVSLTVQDRELAVLLINQYGLFLLARSKWTSMEMVAQWLSSRVRIRRIRTATAVAAGAEDDEEDADGDDQRSVASQISFDEASEQGGKERSVNSRDQRPAAVDNTPASGADHGGKGSAAEYFTMLDVRLDRRVEVSNSVLLQWRGRNVPAVSGMEVSVSAAQDLEMLAVLVRIAFPSSASLRRNAKARQGGWSAGGTDTLDSLDDEAGEEEDENEVVGPVFLSYRLTGAEIAAFGSADVLGDSSQGSSAAQQRKRISVSTNTLRADEKHPETFIWNIFSRLRVTFKGSKSKPFSAACSAHDPANWALTFDRVLVREVRTLSKRVLVLTVSAVGAELEFAAENVDASAEARAVGPKILGGEELEELVHSEGLPVSLLEATARRELATQCLDKLKVVETDGALRLEAHTFPETQMLRVALLHPSTKGSDRREQELGSIEVSYHFTLSDLRVLIRHELDCEDVPTQFRFLYKGTQCSVRQEPFRRAWECLPRCVITPKVVDSSEIAVETDDILHRRMKEQGDRNAANAVRLVRGQRRVAGKFVAVPVPTLCCVTENAGAIYLLHDSKDLLAPGDILRIGHVSSRDYIVSASSRSELNSCPKTVRIDPAYDLLEEPDFSVPTARNFAYPQSGAGVLTYSALFDGPVRLLKTPQELGLKYEFADTETSAADTAGGLADTGSYLSITDGTTGGESAEERSVPQMSKALSKRLRGRQLRVTNQSFADCWLWKCVPAKDDRRPKWRQLYDDGCVEYSYEHGESTLCERHFRVEAPHPYLEVLCTDSRVSSLSFHRQRVDEMAGIPLDTYLRLAFDRVTDWQPQYKKGVERPKFVKLIRDTAAFPDLKRPARIAQIDMLFAKEVKSENGIVQKYITFAGFCRLLQDLALIRFPPKRKIRVQGSATEKPSAQADDEEGEERDDESSVGAGEMEELESLADSAAGSDSVPGRAKGKAGLKAPPKGRSKKQQIAGAEKQAAEDAASSVPVDPAYVAFALQKFVLNHVMTYPEWYDAIWAEAKMAAMRREAVSYCAATRIAAKHRGGQDKFRYKMFLRNLVCLQANIRRKLSVKRTHSLIELLREDWCFRERYHKSTLLQSLARRFLKRCWYHRVMQKVKEQQVLVQTARRFKMKKLRQAARNGVVYKEVKRVNGVTVFVRVLRRDARNYTRDFGVNIEVYVPLSQARYVFSLEEPELRAYMMLELGVEAVSAGDLLDKRNLKRLVASRLIIHKPNAKSSVPHVVFSKHALGQRGERTVTKAKRIAGEFFVARIFETGDDLAVQLYHRLTCRIFTCAMGVPELRAWMEDEHRIACRDEEERRLGPPQLRPGRKNEYHAWVLDHLAVDTRRGQFKVLFSCHLLKSRKMQMVVRIQAAFRRALVRPRIVGLLDSIMLKVRVSAYDDTVYYVNRLTGASSWEKPRLLGPADLPTEPVRKWMQLSYQKDGATCTHYVNPFTGQYTHLVPPQAARIIQALVRNFLLRPISMTRAEFARAGNIFRSAAGQYSSNPHRLAAVINYAMVCHTILLEEETARRLYGEAVELSEANPLVTRAYALYLLGTCEAPTALNRDRAHLLLGDAKRKDDDHSKFQTAYLLFKFACLRRPRDHRTLLNLALVQCVLYDQNHNAEKLLRRALALAPFEERVMEIWKYLRDRFPERQLLYSSVSRVMRTKTGATKRVVHGRPVVEDPAWAGWAFVPEDTFHVSKVHKDVAYWYNPADGTETTDTPDFAVQWAIRRARSQFTEEVLGLEQYYDPLTAEYFQYHSLTDTYS